MKPLNVKNIKEDIYNASIFVCFGDWQEYRKFVKNKFGIEDKKEDVAGKFEAYVNDKTKQETLCIWFDKWNDFVVLHECLHASIYLLTNRGVKIKPGNDEPFCYYATWLFYATKQAFNKIK